ncbi:M23 family metallopeptidase [Solihabitans fulvus]|uniref:M23 family metallopeptidase n=1 Tax=Solihabitans fulvus TaxID=1892852 RepID=A0A5B2XC27_9PSEU|nr:M23 family metallopeptidase [Solihabitans fulvus]KAA2260744.1 M23 family metallopeptidase [Solihabitans fulvus]
MTRTVPAPALAALLTALCCAALCCAAAPPTHASAITSDPPVRAEPLHREARFGWPLRAPHPVLRPFIAPATPFGPGHRGVDLGGAADQEVLAAGDGIALFAGLLVDRPLVSIAHGGGLSTTYEPIEPTVVVGQPVHRGEVIGHLRPGHQGCGAAPGRGEGPDVRLSGGPAAAGVCLHWGARRGRDYLDPLRLVAAPHVRLLPVEGRISSPTVVR